MLAVLPFSVLMLVVVLSFLDGEYGLPAVMGAAVNLAIRRPSQVAATA